MVQQIGHWNLKPDIIYFQLFVSIVNLVFPQCRERAYLPCVPIYPTCSITPLHITLPIVQQLGKAATALHLRCEQKSPTDLHSVIHLKNNPIALKRAQPALCDGAGEESGKACRARSWDSFLQQCPQLVQLQLLGKFHLGFHCLPHSIPYYICNSLSEAHHYVSPLFLNSSPGLNVGKVWTASWINRALANISVPPPPRQWLLYRGQSWKPWVNTWKPLQKTQDSDSTWSHKTSKVLSETWGWWEFRVPVPAWIWG